MKAPYKKFLHCPVCKEQGRTEPSAQELIEVEAAAGGINKIYGCLVCQCVSRWEDRPDYAKMKLLGVTRYS